MPINTLLAPSTVCLFGRVVVNLEGKALVKPALAKPAGKPEEQKLPEEVAASQGSSGFINTATTANRLAHIFAFSHEGRYTPMLVPALVLVHGDGRPVEVDGVIDPARLGLAHLEKGNLTFASDLKFWAYDRGVETMRLDMSVGTLLQVVIDAETGPAGGQGRRVDVFGQEGSAHARLARGSY